MSRAFFLPTYLFFFLTIFFLESVTILLPKLSTTNSVINSASVTSVKREAFFSRYLIAEMWKQRNQRVLSAMVWVLNLSNFWPSISQSWLTSKYYLSGITLVRGFRKGLIIILLGFLMAITRYDIVGAILTTIITFLKNVLLQRG